MSRNVTVVLIYHRYKSVDLNKTCLQFRVLSYDEIETADVAGQGGVENVSK
jgi:hypothetical protein